MSELVNLVDMGDVTYLTWEMWHIGCNMGDVTNLTWQMQHGKFNMSDLTYLTWDVTLLSWGM
jgi:hypothetical protein